MRCAAAGRCTFLPFPGKLEVPLSIGAAWQYGMIAQAGFLPRTFQRTLYSFFCRRAQHGLGSCILEAVNKPFRKENLVDMTIDQIKKVRVKYLALSTLALLFLGLIYAFSMFSAPMCEIFGLEKSQIGLTFNIAMIVTSLGTIVGSQFDMRLGLKVALISTGLFSCIGFACTAVLGYGNLLVVYVFYGAIAGLAAGMGNNIIVASTNVWFPEKTGFSSGVLMMGFSFGTLILGTLSVNLIPMVGLSAVFVGIGVCTAVVCTVLGLTIKRPPANIVNLLAPEKASGVGKEPGEKDKALKTPIFYVYWIWATVVYAIGMATIGACSSDAQSVGIDLAVATLLVGLVSACNGFARIVFGLIYDRTSIKVTMFIDSIVALAATVCIVSAFSTSTPVLYIVGALLCGFCYGGVPVMASAFTRQRYGSKLYPLNLACANLAIMFGSILNVIVQTATTGGARLEVFMVLAVFAIIASVDVLPFSKLWNKDMKMLEERKAEMAEEA